MKAHITNHTTVEASFEFNEPDNWDDLSDAKKRETMRMRIGRKPENEQVYYDAQNIVQIQYQ